MRLSNEERERPLLGGIRPSDLPPALSRAWPVGLSCEVRAKGRVLRRLTQCDDRLLLEIRTALVSFHYHRPDGQRARVRLVASEIFPLIASAVLHL